MRAIVVDHPGAIVLAERPLPEPPPPGWVAIDIANVGICGTDYHIFGGRQPFLSYPRVMGHELSGRVVADGDGFRAGDLVIVNPYIACGECRACRRGKANCCAHLSVLGVHRDGGLCERLNVPARNLIAAGPLGAEQAAMVEFLAIGAHAVRRSALAAADRVAVVGAGPIGLGTALFARLRGAEVHLIDTSPARLALVADRFGFAPTHTDGDAARAAATDGEGFDVVFDATGSNAAIEHGFGLVGHGGTFVLVSVVQGTITFEDAAFHKREMQLLASRNATAEDFATVISAISSGAIDTARLVTHRTPLHQLAERLPGWAASRDTVIKAMVQVEGT